IAREAAQPLHGGEINELVLQNLIGRVWIIGHLPFEVVAHNRCAAQTLEEADLDFLRPKGYQPIETRGKTLQALAGQACNQIGMDINASVSAQKVKIFFESLIILAALDQAADLLVERLNADLELERARGKCSHYLAQPLGQSVRHHFEMHELPRLIALKE